MKTPAKALALTFALTVAACADTSINVADYTTSCAVDTDCAAVFTGETCGCSCVYGAVSVTDQKRYLADYNDKQDSCGALPDCGPCAGATAVCVNKKCSIAMTK